MFKKYAYGVIMHLFNASLNCLMRTPNFDVFLFNILVILTSGFKAENNTDGIKKV